MMSVMNPLLGSLLLLTHVQTSHAKSLLGTVNPPLPKGLIDHGGACVSSDLGFDRICDFMIGQGTYFGAEVLTLEVHVPSSNRRRPDKKVLDILPMPSAPGHVTVFGQCERYGTPGPYIVLAHAGGQQWYDSILLAFKVNYATRTIEATSPEGIRCFNEGYGASGCG